MFKKRKWSTIQPELLQLNGPIPNEISVQFAILFTKLNKSYWKMNLRTMSTYFTVSLQNTTTVNWYNVATILEQLFQTYPLL